MLPENRRIDDIWSVGSSDDEDVLLASHPVHLCEDLVYDPVAGATSVSGSATTGLRNTVQFVKEQHTWGCRTRLNIHYKECRLTKINKRSLTRILCLWGRISVSGKEG